MCHIMLVITVEGRKVVTDHYSDEPAARRALVSFVRAQEHRAGAPHPIRDEDAVEAFFADNDASYTIGMMRAVPRAPGE